jgi:hypothetical protein
LNTTKPLKWLNISGAFSFLTFDFQAVISLQRHDSGLARIDAIQRPIRQQLAQLNHLLNSQRHMPA